MDAQGRGCCTAENTGLTDSTELSQPAVENKKVPTLKHPLDKLSRYADIIAMCILPRFGDVGVALCAVILSVVGLPGAFAADTAGTQTVAAAPSVPSVASESGKQAAPTLSVVHPVPNAGAKSVPAPAMSVAKQPFNMGIDPFKSECQTPAPSQDTVLQPLPNTLTPTIGTSSATKFVPLFKLSDRADDPLNKGNFVEKHEFGIELKTNF